MKKSGSAGSCRPAGFFLLRTPLLPAVPRPHPGESPPPGVLAPASGFGSLPQTLRSAIALASPSLARACAESGTLSDRSAAGTKRSVLRYAIRATRRPVPFGWLAGCSTGTVADRSVMRIASATECRFTARLAKPLVQGIAARAFELLPGDGIRYEASSMAYVAGGDVRFASLGKDGYWTPLATVPAQKAVEAAFQAAAGEGATLEEIAAAVLQASGFVREIPLEVSEQARAFVRSLVDAGLLVSEWTPPVTGPEPLEHLVSVARRVAPDHVLTREIESLASEVEAVRPEGEPSVSERVASRIDRILGAPRPPGALLDARLVRPPEALTLGPAPLEEMARAARLVQRLGQERARDDLAEFARRFAARYQMRAVPLLEALDPQIGVGFGDTIFFDPPGGLLEPIASEGPNRPPDGNRGWYSGLSAALGAIRPGESLRLPDEDPPGRGGGADLPSHFAVITTLIARSAESLDAGEFHLLRPTVATGSAAAMFARFCHADGALLGHVEELVRREVEQAGDAIVADVCFDAPGERGAIAFRPVLYPYEIPYAGRSGAAADRRIPMTDLIVSVRGDRVFLHSRKHGRRVVVRIASTVDGTADALPPVYRFLAAMGFESAGVAGGWSWGPLRHLPYLPRVVNGRSILAPARWVVPGELERGSAEPGVWARELRDRLGLPGRVALVEGLESLPLDLDRGEEAALLRRRLRPGGNLTLEEDLPDDADLLVEGPDGRYRHDLVVPFVTERSKASRESLAPILLSRDAEQDRAEHPGGPALYAKLYADPATQDLIIGILRAIGREVCAEERARSWHFLRYRDPEPHLRFRLLGLASGSLGPIVESLHAALTAHRGAGKIRRTLIDTYDRELERYGGPEAMALAETIFQADSEAAAAIVSFFEASGGSAEARSLSLAHSSYALLADLVDNRSRRLGILERLERAYLSELAVSRDGILELGARHRAHSRELTAIVTGAIREGGLLPPDLIAIVGRRSAVVRESWKRYEPLLIAQGEKARVRVVESLVHLHACRLRGDDVRREELVLYSLLRRAERSVLERHAAAPVGAGRRGGTA